MSMHDTASTGWLEKLPIVGHIYRNRSLVWQFTLRTVHLRHKGSYLGIVWSLVNPLLMLGLYTVAFGLIMKGGFHVKEGETTLDYALGIFIGMSIYGLVAETFGGAPFIIIGNTNLVKKVVFPLEILPVATVLAALYHFCIAMLLCGLGLLFLGPGLTLYALWVPVILFPLILLALGLAWLISALGVYFRDISQITGFFSTLFFYLSAIFFSPSRIPGAFRNLFELNPMLLGIDLTRKVLLWNLPVDMMSLAYLYGFGGLTFVGGYWVFRKLKPGFADVL
ncbi:MAG: ABC transporter permease [Verrucomicrobiota bacterium]|nr:ABC transporter permease [Verrucomicrobiota bacterium]